MMINKKVRIFVSPLYLIMLFCIIAVASSCALATISAFKYSKETIKEADDGAAIGNDPEELFSVDDRITLAWDASPSAVDTYKVLLRVHDTQDWLLLQDNISAAAPLEYTVLHPFHQGRQSRNRHCPPRWKKPVPCLPSCNSTDDSNYGLSWRCLYTSL